VGKASGLDVVSVASYTASNLGHLSRKSRYYKGVSMLRTEELSIPEYERSLLRTKKVDIISIALYHIQRVRELEAFFKKKENEMGIKGRAVAFGTMKVDDYELTGVFVECSKEELKAQFKLHFNENVVIVLEKSLIRR
jgi:hypothetical protein